MRGFKVVSPMIGTETFRNRTVSAQGLTETARCGLAVTISQAELTQNIMQSPFILDCTGLSSPSESTQESVPVLLGVNLTCEEDLSQHESPSKLDAYRALPGGFSDNPGHCFSGTLRVFLSPNELQFDLDPR